MSGDPDATQGRAEALRKADEAEAALSGDPGNLHPLLLAANHCLRAGAPDRAATLVNRAIAGAPVAFASQSLLTHLLIALERQSEALDWARRAVQTRPRNAQAWLRLANLLLAMQRPKEALSTIEMYFTRVEEPSPHAHHLLSAARAGTDDYVGAIQASERAVELDPGSVSFRQHLAALLGHAGRLEEARSMADSAIAIAPNNASAWRVRSGICEQMGDDSQALADAERAVALAPGNEAMQQHLKMLLQNLQSVGDAPPVLAAVTAPPRRRTATRSRRPPESPIRARARAIHALMLREIRTRHARSRLGYSWALLEPIAHLATLGSVFFLLNRAPAPVGEDLFVFYVTGLIPYLAFSHTASTVASSRDSAGGLLQLPAVRPLDLPAARGLLQLVTETLVAMIMLAGLAVILNQNLLPHRLPDTIIAFLCLWLIGCGCGLVGMVISDRLSAWEHLWGAAVRLLYFSSGIYYSPISLPAPILDILAWNPILQGIEWLRSGFYIGYEPPWLDRSYVLRFTVLTLLLGLCLERAARHRMRRVGA